MPTIKMLKKKKQTKKSQQEKITKSMTFNEVLQAYPETTKFFFKHGMACVGCPIAAQESIEQGCLAHGLDPDKIIEEINKVIKKKVKGKK